MAPETLAAVARTESGFDPLAVHDNTDGTDHHPASRDAAIALGMELTVGRHHSVDLGLMQINSGNFPALHLSVSTAFDACLNLAGADQVLVAGYAAPAAGEDQQHALAQALSRYNTGDPARGIANGYVGRVQASAAVVVPAIQLGSAVPNATVAAVPQSVIAVPLPLPPANWDVYGQARAAHGGALVFAGARQPAIPAPVRAPAAALAEVQPMPGEPFPATTEAFRP